MDLPARKAATPAQHCDSPLDNAHHNMFPVPLGSPGRNGALVAVTVTNPDTPGESRPQHR
ncbi:hypothetical protein MMAR_0190 [Mycobacterium marinum M]|uniref:Uncharacterized protein n=1 Tax=Mycobacterium marinum (strain ATCC BAA-535 / M) TaxID=216594 RepID=B2HJJ1_MYCMM|nr:hypothetical protein MMAR_0190 [Mycobacterium marinum M]